VLWFRSSLRLRLRGARAAVDEQIVDGRVGGGGADGGALAPVPFVRRGHHARVVQGRDLLCRAVVAAAVDDDQLDLAGEVDVEQPLRGEGDGAAAPHLVVLDRLGPKSRH
jgi:hypothetical protein